MPEPGQQVTVRGHPWVVKGVDRSRLPPPSTRPADHAPTHLLTLVSLDDDRWEHEIQVIWEHEPGRRIHERATLPTPDPHRLDDPDELEAFLDAVRWGTVTNADKEALQAPFRSGITIEDYQLEPLVRALRMPRVNLLIADDVGLGKTIEAGLVIQELILRHRARTCLVICPAPLQQKWKDEMADKFGLRFEIIDTEAVRQLRRRRGVRANPWTSYPRMITSLDWVKRDRPLRMLHDVLPSAPRYPRAFDMLVVDEAHHVAPSATGRYATDSQRTRAVRSLAPHFEHRLFLSATPHNGYQESWTALLELLDPQRFARGVAPDDAVRDQVVIRRLKSQFVDEDDATDQATRFARRVITPLPVDYSDDERGAHADLQAYSRSRQRDAGASRHAGDFVGKLLKKRPFSSPRAFHETLLVHLETLQRGHSALAVPSERSLRAVLGRIDDEHGTEEEAAEAERDALQAAARTTPDPTDEQRQLLDRLLRWAEGAAGRADTKCRALVDWLGDVVRPDGEWNDERVIVFTEYRDTQTYLVDQLTAAGLAADGRLRVLYGGQDDDEREAIKAAFQADPHLDPVRLLVATDTASEGIDLQRHCHRLVHMEIPWNPNRLEQRNGRIDRHGQTHPTADVFHFVGAGFDADETGTLEADLEFLARAASKIDRIRHDLGSAGPVIADQVEEAMLGRRRTFDEEAVDRRVAARGLTAGERRLREKVRELADRVEESRDLLGLSPDRVERALRVALRLDDQPALRADELVRGDDRHRVLRVPDLDRGWARTKEHGLVHPVIGDELPVTFDHDLAAGHDDVALVHLGHPLVQKALATLRSEIWVEDNPRLARVSAAVAPAGLFDGAHGAVLAHGRLVITGATGSRLHEALITAGGLTRDGNWMRLTVDQVDELTAAAEPRAVAPEVLRPITDRWSSLGDRVLSELRRRQADVANGLARTFEVRAHDDADDVTRILTELRASIEAMLTSPDFEQLQLDLQAHGRADERDQLRVDERALRRRLDDIPGEIDAERAAVLARYEDPTPRTFPAAITLVVPAGRAGAA